MFSKAGSIGAVEFVFGPNHPADQGGVNGTALFYNISATHSYLAAYRYQLRSLLSAAYKLPAGASCG